MKIAISAESTIDLSPEILKEYNIHTLPFTVILGENEYKDGVITPDQIFDYVSKTGVLPKTSAINQNQYETYFNELLKDYDVIIHFTLSSKISSSCNSALSVAKNFKDKVYIIDSLSLSTGIAIQAIYASNLVKANKYTPQEIVDKCLKRVSSAQASFVLARLDYLYKGGRCSLLSALAAKIIGIRPQILVVNGGMIPGKKYRGKDSVVIRKYCEDTLAQFNNPDHSIAFVTATKIDKEMYDIAEQMLKQAGFKKVYRTVAGSTITSHCGERTLGILYYNDGDEGHD